MTSVWLRSSEQLRILVASAHFASFGLSSRGICKIIYVQALIP
jgi:hypothetical protein